MTIHFGPGTFQTRGFGALTTGFVVLNGQRFIGSGMHQTTLQIVKAVPDPSTEKRDGVGVFGTESNVADVEISDMTLDCNLSRQANFPAQMTGVGVGFPNGSRIRLKRVRIINWGTQTKLDEGFPVYIVSQGGDAIGEAVIEDCIVEQPALSQARECTLLVTRAAWNSPRFFATIRNCYVNCDYTTGSPPLPVEVSSISGTSVTTKWPHRVQAGDEVYFSGYPNPGDNKRIKVTSADDSAGFTVEAAPTPIPANTTILAQRYVPRAMTVAKLTFSGLVATLETSLPHLREVDDYIRV